jgi:hypothetical protein
MSGGYMALEFVAESKAAACAREEKAREDVTLVGIIFKI